MTGRPTFGFGQKEGQVGFRTTFLPPKRNVCFTASLPPPTEGGPAPETDPREQHAGNWPEPKVKLLEKKKKHVGAFDPVLHPRHWAQLIHKLFCHQRIRSCRGKEIKDRAFGVVFGQV
jgi:hypothetical protein